ncbi:hypothetical protein [Streptomyces rubiginosohelvolus]|uniref:hypothetical protein n=1 Tax=Streptomyces rubiginosohelvolus TaxID=67362 RepID=UPI0037CE8CF7
MRPRGVRPGKSEDASYGALGEGDVVRGASGDRDGHRLQGGDHRRGGVAARWARRDRAPAAAADQAFAGGEQRGDGLVDRWPTGWSRPASSTRRLRSTAAMSRRQ